MVSLAKFLKKVVEDEEVFTELVLHAEAKQSKRTSFGTGFLLGLWLGRMHMEAEMKQKSEVTHVR